MGDETPAQPSHKHVRLGSASAFALTAQVLTLATGFIAQVLIARTLGPAGKGQLAELQQVPAILAIALNLGITSANTYFVGRKEHGVGEVLGNSLFAAGLLGALGIPVSLLFTLGPAAVVKDIPVAAALIAAASLPFTLGGQFVQGINVGVGEMKALARTQVAGAVTSIAVVAGAFATGHLTVAVAVLATALNVIVAFALNATRLVKRHSHGLKLRLSYMKEASRYSSKAYFSNLAGYLNYRSDVIVVGYLAGAATVGIYSVAVTFAELMWYAPNALASALLSKSMQSEASDREMLVLRSSRVTALLMLVICLAAGLLISPVIGLFYGSKFLPAVLPFLLLLPGVWMIGIARILSANLAARGLLYPWISIVSAVGNIVANLILVPKFGAAGAALASTLSYGGGATATMVMFARETKVSPRHWLLVTKRDMAAISTAAKSYAGQLAARRGR